MMDSVQEDEQDIYYVFRRDDKKHSMQEVSTPREESIRKRMKELKARPVVSSKLKTHHPVVVRRKPPAAGRPHSTGNKENNMDPWLLPLNVNKLEAGGTDCQHADSFTLSELTRDHSTMIDVLFGRNLRLKVALTMWQRNVGELLMYLERIDDTSVIVDLLPSLTKSIKDDSSGFTIGCCVDLFPFVEKVLSSRHEQYLAVGFKWIQSVLEKWFDKLQASSLTERTDMHSDKNVQVFKQQLLKLWHQDPGLTLLMTIRPSMANVINSYLSRLA